MRPTMPMVAASPAARVRPATASFQSTEPTAAPRTTAALTSPNPIEAGDTRCRSRIGPAMTAAPSSMPDRSTNWPNTHATHAVAARTPAANATHRSGRRRSRMSTTAAGSHRRDGRCRCSLRCVTECEHGGDAGRDGHQQCRRREPRVERSAPDPQRPERPPDRELVLKPPTASPSPRHVERMGIRRVVRVGVSIFHRSSWPPHSHEVGPATERRNAGTSVGRE